MIATARRVRRTRRFTRLAAVVAAACVAVVRADGRPAGAQDSPVASAIDRGAYRDAEQLARARLLRAEQEVGAASTDLVPAIADVVSAMVQNGEAARDEALALSDRVIRLADGLPDTDARLTTALESAGEVRAARGEYTQAVALYQRAVRIESQRGGGGDEPRLAAALEHLVDALIELERFDEAAPALESAARIRTAHRESDPLGLAGAEARLAAFFRRRGELGPAQDHLDVALNIRKRLTPGHPEIASLRHLQGDIAFLSGNISDARMAYAEAVRVGTETLGATHPATGLYLRKLAAAEWAFGNAGRARELREQALRIAETTRAPCHPELPLAVNDLAASDLDAGDYPTARALFERARAQLERCLGPAHSLVATAVYNLAGVAKQTGDWAEAERLLNGAIRIWSSALGPEHQFVIRAQDSLADVAEGHGLLRRALAMHQRVLATRRKVLGANHPDVARTLTTLAVNAQRLGDTALALRYADEAEAIYARVGATDGGAPLATLLTLRADIERAQGNRDAAAGHLEAARDMRIERFGARHPSVAAVTASIATIDLESGNAERAASRALGAEETGRNLLQFTIRALPERQALAYADNRPKGLALAISAASLAPDGVSNVYDAVIRSRGLVLDELAARAHVVDADASDPAVTALQHEMTAARQRYANLMLRAIQSAASVPAESLESARVEKERAERALAERSADARAELARSRAGLDEVRAALPSGAALVSFVRYDRTRRPERIDAPPRPVVPSYAAFVMTGGSSGGVSFVPLGSAGTIDSLVRGWRVAVLAGAGSAADAEARYQASAAPLRAAVWDPVARHVARATRIFIVPDGLLNLVNFASLPSTNGRYLAESTQTLHYLATERDLLVDAPRATMASALVVGRPAFDSAPRRVSGTRGGCVAAGEWHFGDLPGTGLEARDISRVWSSSGGDVTLLTGAGATKAAFRQALGSRRVVHLATHGFFLGEGCEPGASASRSVGGLVAAPQRTASPSGPSDNPLLLSGLALAGANRRTPAQGDQDNGILTAEEIASLDLQGTEWAVLSACDTGLGEIRSGEGVFGLRRAFQIAGARTVIMSLWSVDDAATRLWMRALYEGRLVRHLDTADAVRQASLAVLQQRRAAHLSTHPFYWAAFVAAGDWR